MKPNKPKIIELEAEEVDCYILEFVQEVFPEAIGKTIDITPKPDPQPGDQVEFGTGFIINAKPLDPNYTGPKYLNYETD